MSRFGEAVIAGRDGGRESPGVVLTVGVMLCAVQAWRLSVFLPGGAHGDGDRAILACHPWFAWIPSLIVTPDPDLFHPALNYLAARVGLAISVSSTGLLGPTWALAVLLPGVAVAVLSRRHGLATAALVAAWLGSHPLVDRAAGTFSSLSATLAVGLLGWWWFEPAARTGALRFDRRDLLVFWLIFNSTVLSWWIAVVVLTTWLVTRRSLREFPSALWVAGGLVAARLVLGFPKVAGGIQDAAARASGGFGWSEPAGPGFLATLIGRPVDLLAISLAAIGLASLWRNDRMRAVYWSLATSLVLPLVLYSFTNRVKDYYAVLALPGLVFLVAAGAEPWLRRAERGGMARALILAAAILLPLTTARPTPVPNPPVPLEALAPGLVVRIATCEAEEVFEFAWAKARRSGDLTYLRSCSRSDDPDEPRWTCKYDDMWLWGLVYPHESGRDWETSASAWIDRNRPEGLGVVCRAAAPSGPVLRLLATHCMQVASRYGWYCAPVSSESGLPPRPDYERVSEAVMFEVP